MTRSREVRLPPNRDELLQDPRGFYAGTAGTAAEDDA